MFPLTPGFFTPELSHWFTMRSKANNGICMDVTASGGAGSSAISYGCHAASNQRWEFVPVSESDQSLVTIRPRHALGTRLTYDASNSELIQNASSSASQQWYVQQITTTAPLTFQFVSVANGRCLSLRSTSNTASMPTVPCTDSTAQIVLEREPLTYSQSGSTLRFTFGGHLFRPLPPSSV
ncbi:RICIN domain-containing protein [Leucobacter coleopterorum]